MPIYDYLCGKCKHEFEVFYTTQSAVEREEKLEKCPTCGSKRKKRTVPKRIDFQLKGKWFREGY